MQYRYLYLEVRAILYKTMELHNLGNLDSKFYIWKLIKYNITS